MIHRIVRTLRNKRFWCWLLPICWLIGHNIKGGPLIKGRISSRGGLVDSWHYYCGRCSQVEGEGADALQYYHRSIFGRTVPLYISRWRNARMGREFARSSERNRESYLARINEQLKKLAAQSK